MSGGRNGHGPLRVAVDLNTQVDYCDPLGIAPVMNLPDVLTALRRIFLWVRRQKLPLVSSVEAHRPFELPRRGFPLHCIDGSVGQRKLDFTLFPCRAFVQFDNTLAVPNDLFVRYQQVVFAKRNDDLLSNPKADRFLTQLTTEEFLLFGNTVERSVKALALGLMARGKKVRIVVDACGYWNKAEADMALRQVVAKGAALCTALELPDRIGESFSATSSGSTGEERGRNGRGNGRTPGEKETIADPHHLFTDRGFPGCPDNASLAGGNGRNSAQGDGNKHRHSPGEA